MQHEQADILSTISNADPVDQQHTHKCTSDLSVDARAQRIQADLEHLVQQAKQGRSENNRLDELQQELQNAKQRLAELEYLELLKWRILEVQATYERFMAMKQLCMPKSLPSDHVNWRVHAMAEAVGSMAGLFEGIWESLKRD